MFKFDFSFDDVEVDAKLAEELADVVIVGDKEPERAEGNVEEYQASFEEIRVEDLLERLPDVISYSSLSVPVLSPVPVEIPYSSNPESDSKQAFTSPETGTFDRPPLKLLRRDLFDVRFQLAVQTDLDPSNDGSGGPGISTKDNKEAAGNAANFIENPSDLIAGVYEGGFKTWECSLDLVGCLGGQSLLQDHSNNRDGMTNWGDMSRKRVLELGCGTAIPSMYLLYRLLNSSNPGKDYREAGSDLETELHLQDYNAAVLELVSLPNLLLAWYLSEASASYRSSTINQYEGEDHDNERHLSLTLVLKSAFLQSLKEHNIKIRFFAGSWLGFFRNVLGVPEGTGNGRQDYNLVLTSETIYRKESLGELVDVLKAASSGARPHPCLCLVAAKLVYFGVGGGIEEFIREVEKRDGVACGVVWEGPLDQHGGVRRQVIRVAWQ